MQTTTFKNLRYSSTMLAFVFSVCLTAVALGKGSSGTYFIIGTAYSSNKIVLKNATLTLTFGNETKTIVTDSSGHFEIELAWTNTCPSNQTATQHKKANKKINPQFVYIGNSDKEIKLKNKWKKYVGNYSFSKEAITWRKDLYF